MVLWEEDCLVRKLDSITPPVLSIFSTAYFLPSLFLSSALVFGFPLRKSFFYFPSWSFSFSIFPPLVDAFRLYFDSPFVQIACRRATFSISEKSVERLSPPTASKSTSLNYHYQSTHWAFIYPSRCLQLTRGNWELVAGFPIAFPFTVSQPVIGLSQSRRCIWVNSPAARWNIFFSAAGTSAGSRRSSAEY